MFRGGCTNIKTLLNDYTARNKRAHEKKSETHHDKYISSIPKEDRRYNGLGLTNPSPLSFRALRARPEIQGAPALQPADRARPPLEIPEHLVDVVQAVADLAVDALVLRADGGHAWDGWYAASC